MVLKMSNKVKLRLTTIYSLLEVVYLEYFTQTEQSYIRKKALSKSLKAVCQ